MVVIDDPNSILKCTNKVYLAELLKANILPAPKTVIVDRGRIPSVEQEILTPSCSRFRTGLLPRRLQSAEPGRIGGDRRHPF